VLDEIKGDYEIKRLVETREVILKGRLNGIETHRTGKGNLLA
jgi:hypothetical protein